MKPDFFSRYEALLLPAAQEAIEAGRARGKTRRPSARLRATVIALAALLLLVGAAVAASGLLPIGREVPVKNRGGKTEPAHLTGRVVVASGRTPVHGRWQLFWSRSSVGDCVALQLLDDRGALGLGEGCGRSTRITASALLPIPGAATPVETLIYGRVPDAAREVRVTLPRRGTRTVKTAKGPGDIAGNWYLVSFNGIPGPGTGVVVALDRSRRPLGSPYAFPITLHPRYAAPTTRYVGGRLVAVTDGGYALVSVSCRHQRHREGKCLGTISVRVPGHGLGNCGRTRAHVRCGWRFFALAPGTTRKVLRLRLGSDVVKVLRQRRMVSAHMRVSGRRFTVVLRLSGS